MAASAPFSSDPDHARRQRHTRVRRRILYGEHEDDVRGRVREALKSVRAESVEPIDMGSNPFTHVCEQLAALYDEEPDREVPAGGEDTDRLCADAGLWPLQQRTQRDTIGMRDLLLRVDLVGDEGRPVFTPIPPDLAEPVVDRSVAGRIVSLSHYDYDEELEEWVRHVIDPRTATYVRFDSSDVQIGEALTGEAYPWRIAGEPVLPVVSYHAAETGHLFDPYAWREIVDGSLQLGLLYTLYAHAVRNASWMQRYLLGAEPRGAEERGTAEGRRSHVTAAPDSVLSLQKSEDYDGQPLIGAFPTPIDPDRILQSVVRYERRLVELAVGGADVSRSSSDVRSGYSLAVSREATRAAQRRYAPLFRRSDERLLALVSGLRDGPVEGWRVRHKMLPRDPAEMREQREHLAFLVANGAMTRPQMLRELNPGLSMTEARAEAERIRRENAQFT